MAKRKSPEPQRRGSRGTSSGAEAKEQPAASGKPTPRRSGRLGTGADDVPDQPAQAAKASTGSKKVQPSPRPPRPPSSSKAQASGKAHHGGRAEAGSGGQGQQAAKKSAGGKPSGNNRDERAKRRSGTAVSFEDEEQPQKQKQAPKQQQEQQQQQQQDKQQRSTGKGTKRGRAAPAPPSSDSEPEVDQTVYRGPKDSVLPAEQLLARAQAPEGGKAAAAENGGSRTVAIPTPMMGELLAAYNLLRSFSWQLRLSPFTFDNFCMAMALPQPTVLMDELHVCLLRALVVDETPQERADHTLDLGMLDHMSWPAFAWEWLRLTDDPLVYHEWAHRVGSKAGSSGDGSGSRDGEDGKAAAGTRRAFAPLPDVAAVDAQLAAGLQEVPSVQEQFGAAAPVGPARPREYYQLPLDLKAAILLRLCDGLLDCVTIRAEINRREKEGEFVAGKGGTGGAFPIMTPEEREAADAKAVRQGKSDANAENCVLCGEGGALLCCDKCPGAYHMRCIGEHPRSLGDGDYYCPECSMGGRGEAAGLRIPVAAQRSFRGGWKQPLHVMHGMVVRTEAPPVRSSGEHAEELEEEPVPAVRYVGEEASRQLSAAVRPKNVDEVPHPSSYDAVADPPKILIDVSLGPEGYVNKYANAWGTALAQITAALDDVKRKRHRQGIWIPTGTCGRLDVETLPAPLELPSRDWVQLQGRLPTRRKCGKCKHCLRPSFKKGCLNPVVTAPEGAPDASKLGFLAAEVIRTEREWWALLEGPWSGPEGMLYRQQWAQRVRAAGSVEEVAQRLLELESNLRHIAVSEEWAGAAVPSKTPVASRGISRATSAADLAVAASQAGSDVEDGEQQPADGVPLDSRALAAVARAADPYDVRYEKMTPKVRAGWEINKRAHAVREAGVNRLPLAMLRKAARQAGQQPIPGIRYRRLRWTVPERTAWVARTEAARSVPQLALCIRQLQKVLRSEDATKPKDDSENAFARAELLGKRPAQGEAGSEYELQMRKLEESDPAVQRLLAQQRIQQLQVQLQAQMQAAVLVQQQQQEQQQERQEGASAAAPGEQSPQPGQMGPPPAGLPAVHLSPLQVLLQQQLGVPAVPGALAQPAAAPGSQVLSPGPALPAPSNQCGSRAPSLGPAGGSNDNPAAVGLGSASEEDIPKAAAATPSAQAPSMSEVPLSESGRATRRCGQCHNCLNPQFKKACVMLSTQRELTREQQELEQQERATEEAERQNDPAFLAHKLTQDVFDNVLARVRAEALTDADAPAAMAAKMRARMSAAAAAEAKKEAKKEAAAQPAPLQGVRSKSSADLAKLASSQAPTSNRVMSPELLAQLKSSTEPVWVHENVLPLWLIRAYEERVGREAANAVAKDAVARSRALTNATPSTKQAAQAAARQAVAAAAAADVCGICSTSQGDRPEEDGAWVSCDLCSRWFHGSCVKLSAEAVQSMTEEDAWHCPGCAEMLRRQERAARSRQPKKPVLFSPGAPAEGYPSGHPRRGRPPKPMHEKADYRRLEQEALQRMAEGGASGGSIVRKGKAKAKQPLAPEEAEARRLAQAKRKRAEEQRALREAEIWCPVCWCADMGRELLECSACGAWVHHACAKVTPEQCEAAAAAGQPFKCLQCQGQRARRPSQAAIDLAITAAAAAEEADKDAHPCKRLRHADPVLDVAAAAAADAGVSMHTAESWAAAAGRVLSKAMDLPSAAMFVEPVDTEEFDDYLETLAEEGVEPMDLGTAKERLAAGHYASPLALLADVRKVWAACCAYNNEGSEIVGLANQAQHAFEMAWQLECLPLFEEQWQPARAQELRAQAAADVAAGLAGPGVSKKRKADEALGVEQQQMQEELSFDSDSEEEDEEESESESDYSEARPAKRQRSQSQPKLQQPPPQQQPQQAQQAQQDVRMPAPDWLLRAAYVLAALLRLPCSESFSEPVPPEYTYYYEVIEEPRDLGTMAAHLQAGRYSSPAQIERDIALVFHNCRTFNEPDAPVVAAAAECEAAWRSLWQQAQVWLAPPAVASAQQPAQQQQQLQQAQPLPPPPQQQQQQQQAPQQQQQQRQTQAVAGALRPPSRANSGVDRGKQLAKWPELARKALYRMSRERCAVLFQEPVSLELVPDYAQVIARPMDFGTISNKLQGGEYPTLNELQMDVAQIWANCMQYNGPDHEVSQLARESAAAWQKHCQKLGLEDLGRLEMEMLQGGGGGGAPPA